MKKNGITIILVLLLIVSIGVSVVISMNGGNLIPVPTPTTTAEPTEEPANEPTDKPSAENKEYSGVMRVENILFNEKGKTYTIIGEQTKKNSNEPTGYEFTGKGAIVELSSTTTITYGKEKITIAKFYEKYDEIKSTRNEAYQEAIKTGIGSCGDIDFYDAGKKLFFIFGF